MNTFVKNNSFLISKKNNLNWSPQKLGQSLALWLDASDTDMITLNGPNVSSWKDKLTTLSMVQTVQTQQPLYVANQLNGKSIIRTDGTDDFMSLLSETTFSLESRKTLPDGGLGSVEGKGWTCTGLFYDAIEHVWWVSNDGRSIVGSPYSPSIIKMNFEATTILEQIDIKAIYPDNTTVQGLVIDPQNDSIWFAALQENKLRNITKSGVSLGELSLASPNGLAYDPSNNTLIVLNNGAATGAYIRVINKTSGTILRSYFVSIPWPDHLYFNPSTRNLYITYDDGVGASVAICDHDAGKVITKIGVLSEADAVEGVSIIDNNLYILNDAYFHSGTVQLNEMLRYKFVSPVSNNINIFVVGKARTLTSTETKGWYYAGVGPTTSVGWGVFPLFGDQSVRVFINGGSFVFSDFVVNGNATSNYAVTTLSINQLTKVASFAVNGGSGTTFSTSGANTLPSIGNFTFGRGGNGRYSTSDTAEIVITNSDISIDERQKIEGYLAHKWGLTANLPNEHPYKSSPPT